MVHVEHVVAVFGALYETCQAEVKYSKPGLCMSYWEQATHTSAEQD